MESERINKQKLINALKSYVTGIATDERKFHAQQGNSEYDRLLDTELNLDVIKQREKEADGDDAHSQMLRE